MSAPASEATLHRWKFFRAGGFDQVKLDSGADLAHLDELDPKLWGALSCPTRGLEFDSATLDLIDTDKDGRIRVPEIIAAAKWACACLKDADQLVDGPPELALANIDDSTPEGTRLLSSAKQILANLGKSGASSIGVEDTSDTTRIFAQTRFNGDGIVPADAAGDAGTKALMEDIIACLGGEADRSGKSGLSQAKLVRFFSEVRAYAEWQAQGERDAKVRILGELTAAVWTTCEGLRAKLDDYYARCRLAAFDERALGALNRSESEFLAIAAGDMKITSEEVCGFPLARIAAGKPLPLREGLNPAWATAVAKFTAEVVQPLLGARTALTESDWQSVKDKLAPFGVWMNSKAGSAVESLGLARVREILAGNGLAAVGELIAKDKALEPEANSIAAVDRLARYQRDLAKLLTNYVSFRDFYDRGDKAIFQAGTLYLDQRSCELCIRVEDMGKHAALAGLSRTFLTYCDLTRKHTGEKMTIAAAFTDGDSDNLMVGRNGIFYDRQGQDWDATIIKIVDQPISIRQAFWAPYKKAIRWIEEMVAKRAAAADEASTKRLTDTAGSVGDAATPAAPAAPPPPKPKLDIGVVAAIGVAVGGITAALGAMLQAFFGLGMWMPLGVVAIVLLISGPSMVIAWLKLRQRNLGPILDANGWAVNTQAKINIPFGRSLTATAKLPPGAQRDLFDPYADSKASRNWLIAGLIVLVLGFGLYKSWQYGWLHRIGFLSGLPTHAEVFPPSEAAPEKPAAADEAAK